MAAPVAAGAPGCAERLVYFGTQAAGPGKGIFLSRLDAATGRLSAPELAAEVGRPTWLLADPARRMLFAVSDEGAAHSAVLGFRVDPATGKLGAQGEVASGGVGPTHLALDRTGRNLFVANFGSGQVAALPVTKGGALGAASSVQDYGTGPTPRQKGPHAHAVIPDPTGRFLLVPDLGADRIFVYRFDAARGQLSPAATPFVQLPPGSGPRHLVFDPSGRFVFAVSELTSELRSFRWDGRNGRLDPLASRSTLPPGYQGPDSRAAEIAFLRDGRHLLVSNRGEDMIVVYRLDERTGALTEMQRMASGGKGPWAFALEPQGRWLVVANQASETIAVLRVDPRSGRLGAPVVAANLGKPVSVAILPGTCSVARRPGKG